MKKVVVKVAVHDEKEKQKAMHVAAGLSGIESFGLDMNDQKLTMTGDIDPVDVVAKLRKHWYTEIISFGPPEKKNEESTMENAKKEESKTDEPKKENEKQDEEEDDKKTITEAEQIADLIIASNNYCPYHPCIQPYYYSVPQPENPNTCVIS